MTARELYDRLGRALEDHIVDADAEVFVSNQYDEFSPIGIINPENVAPKTLRSGLVGSASVALRFARLT